jgi:ABC-type sugar transport system ATPase subunit
MALSDRIAVMYRGRVMEIVEAAKVDKEYLGLLMVESRLRRLPKLPRKTKEGAKSSASSREANVAQKERDSVRQGRRAPQAGPRHNEEKASRHRHRSSEA